MTDAPETPQIYLVTPPAFRPDEFVGVLSRVLDGAEIACLRLSLAAGDAAEIGRAADQLRGLAHARDVPVVVARHPALAERHGLDGVHLEGGAAELRATRRALGRDAIVGAACGTSRHAGLIAGEAGADYVAFGPAGDTGLGEDVADPDLFAWWSEMIELPVVAEGGLDTDTVAALAPVTDFFAIGPEIWGAEDPLAALRALTAPLR